MIGGQAVKAHGFRLVWGDAETVFIHQAEIVLSSGIALCGGQAIPLYCLGVALRNALTIVVKPTDFVLGNGVALLSKWAY